MALGRLGSGEFDVLSDADLLFVCGESHDRFALAKFAEQMTQALAAYTQDGMVFPVDARLRPHGAEGELLVTPAQLASYCEKEAQAWEALTYTKLRFVAGDRELAQQAATAAGSLSERFAEDAQFSAAVREMRSRLEAESPEKNFKTSSGAVYDLDFLTGYLLVKRRAPEKGGTLRDRLWRCVAIGALEKADAGVLDHAAELLRTTEHVVRLVVGRAHKWLPATQHAYRVVERLTSGILRRSSAEGLEAELLEACGNVRSVYDRVLSLQ